MFKQHYKVGLIVDHFADGLISIIEMRKIQALKQLSNLPKTA